MASASDDPHLEVVHRRHACAAYETDLADALVLPDVYTDSGVHSTLTVTEEVKELCDQHA